MSNLEASYKFILEELKKISGVDNFYFKPIKPKLSDIELISLVILAEFKSIDSEHQLFREIKGFEIASKTERSEPARVINALNTVTKNLFTQTTKYYLKNNQLD